MKQLLKQYPKTVAGPLTLRPMQVSDKAGIIAFFKRIPVDERQLFREDVTQVRVIQGWIRNLDYGIILPLLALAGTRIVAMATLHRDRGGWARHLGKVRLTLDPDFRGRGLGRLLTKEFIALSEELGVAVLEAEVLDVQKRAALFFEELGFQCVAVLPQHAIDLTGRVHDILVYALTISQPERLAPEAALAEKDADVGGG